MKIIPAVLAALALAAPASALNGNDPAHAWVTDGSVYAVAATPSQLLVGGDFTLIGRETGSWVSLEASGAVPQADPAWYGTVLDAVPDGARGWFLLTADPQSES